MICTFHMWRHSLPHRVQDPPGYSLPPAEQPASTRWLFLPHGREEWQRPGLHLPDQGEWWYQLGVPGRVWHSMSETHTAWLFISFIWCWGCPAGWPSWQRHPESSGLSSNHTLECGWSYTGQDLVTASFQVLIQSMFTLRSYCWLLSLETIVHQLQEDSHLQRRRRRSVLDSILQAKRSVSDVSPTYVITLCCYGNNMWNVSCGSWIVNVVDKTGLPGAAPNQ